MGNDTAVLPSISHNFCIIISNNYLLKLQTRLWMVFVKKSLRISAIGGDYNIFDIVPNIVKLNQKSVISNEDLNKQRRRFPSRSPFLR
jgi:hypothetical protein